MGLMYMEVLVLNLVISGIPSIPEMKDVVIKLMESFKPCYKWNTFNTIGGLVWSLESDNVLNLVISGIPSIPLILIRILILWLVNSLFRG